MIYFDNSASTLVKPKEVQQMVNLAMNKFSANPGRSGHRQSRLTGSEVENVRQNLADFFCFSNPERVIFTQNCSDALNLAILGSAKQNGHVICTENEHNSSLRPLQYLKEKGIINYTIVSQSEKKGITKNDIEKNILPNTYLIICNHISNVNGAKAEIEEIGKLCQSKNILFLVDGAQSAGHEEINMEKFKIDMLAIAPHKGFYSLQGLGVLLLSEKANISPIRFGGTGTNSLELNQPSILPERFEVGTLPTPAILGLGGGLIFVKNNYKEIREKLEDLTTFLHYELSKLPIKIYTHPDNANGVLSFNIPSLHSNEVCSILNEKWGICTRGGYHCAPKKHQSLNTLETGTVRVSFSYFNSINEVQKLLGAVKNILKSSKI